jgi:hypothetical protein
MKRENIEKVVEMCKDLKDLEMCRDLIQGGARVAVENNDMGIWMLPISESLKLSLTASIQGRIDEINEELEEL